MAKNLGRKYATMTEDERRQFALQEEEGTRDLPAQLAFEEPRNQEGRHYPNPQEEVADPEHRDGLSAQLDDEQHRRRARQAARRKSVTDNESARARPEDA